MDEKKLIAECLKGNSRAQYELYQKHAPKMLGVCYRYAHSLEDAEDVLQEGFVKVFTGLHQFRGEGSLEGWIRKIMVNLSINQLKKMNPVFRAEEVQEEMQWQEPEMDAEAVMEEIRALPPGFKAVFNLYALEGYSHKEIADMLSISESTSRSQYARARAMLMKKLSAHHPVKEIRHDQF